MADVRIVTDSSWDMPQEEMERHNITEVPLVVIFGQEEYLEPDLTRDEFWAKAASVHPRTSQPSPGDFETAFRELVDAGHDVVCITVTGKHSGTYNSAHTAAANFPAERVALVDSRALSWTHGFQVLAAARLAESGASLTEIVEYLADMQDRTHLFILFDTMEYLERGGRAALLMPVVKRVAKAFNIKPIINVVDGELTLRSAVRSSDKGTQRLVEEAGALAPFETLAALHVRNPDGAERLRLRLAEAFDLAPEALGRSAPLSLATEGQASPPSPWWRQRATEAASSKPLARKDLGGSTRCPTCAS